MSFLVALLSSLLQWLLTRLAQMGVIAYEKKQVSDRIEDSAKKDAEAIKEAKTKKEREDALKRSIDNTFGS